MADEKIHDRITALVGEERALRGASHHTDDDRARLTALEVELDQLWDLLRQRDARRAAGQSVGEATERPASEVEGYLQ